MGSASSKDNIVEKERCISILRSTEVETFALSRMCFELSSSYDNKTTTALAASVILGLVLARPLGKPLGTIVRRARGRDVSRPISKISRALNFGIAATSVTVATYGLGLQFTGHWKETVRDFNRAGTAWNKLNKDIELFLATSDINKTMLEDYNIFIQKCNNDRQSISLIVSPDQKVYEQYFGDTVSALKSLSRKYKGDS